MSTYEKASQARDVIADSLLDGVRVISVGVRNAGNDYQVGVTATTPVNLPAMPVDLRDVPVRVEMITTKAHRQWSHSHIHRRPGKHWWSRDAGGWST